MGTMAIVALVGKILSVIGGFAIAATATPNSSPNTFLDMLLRAINVLGGNVGQARNR